MPTYLNSLNNAILRANLPKSKGHPAAYGELGRGRLGGVAWSRSLRLPSLYHRHHRHQPPHEQDECQPLPGLSVGAGQGRGCRYGAGPAQG